MYTTTAKMADVAVEEPCSIGHVQRRLPGDRSHFCVSCSFPIAVYGRLYPCLHAFCLACASDMEECFLCHASIARLERWPRENGLYISPATLQTFRSEDELIQHTKKVYPHLVAAVQAAERKAAAAAAAAKREREEAAAKAEAAKAEAQKLEEQQLEEQQAAAMLAQQQQQQQQQAGASQAMGSMPPIMAPLPGGILSRAGMASGSGPGSAGMGGMGPSPVGMGMGAMGMPPLGMAMDPMQMQNMMNSMVMMGAAPPGMGPGPGSMGGKK